MTVQLEAWILGGFVAKKQRSRSKAYSRLIVRLLCVRHVCCDE